MIVVKGNNSRKIETIWDLVKKDHSGSKVAVLSHKGELPHSFVRGKQMRVYETLTKEKLLQETEAFMASVKDRFEALVLYVNCEDHLIDSIKELSEKYQQKVFLTVHDADSSVTIKEY
ncbi:hypothetical protein [Enterococcus sp. LJL51]|uniref:hypothetical protein n=1 Tax=Enterococcus sp. LJL51 TaxID=3416656 RepID=UPI003CFAEB26